MNNQKIYIKRGDIYLADLGLTYGAVQSGERPVLIIQNDIGNYYSPTCIVACITSQIDKKPYQPTHYFLSACGLDMPSVVMAEQLMTLDKSQLIKRIGRVPQDDMWKIDTRLQISIGTANPTIVNLLYKGE